MATIIWSDDDVVDPYPAILENLGHLFMWAASPHVAGSMNEVEGDLIRSMHGACSLLIAGYDPDSLSLIDPTHTPNPKGN